MNKDLSLQQAQKLLDYLKNSSDINKFEIKISNVEILSGLILASSYMYLELIIAELQAKK